MSKDKGDGRSCIVVTKHHDTPALCVDVIVESARGILLIDRKNPPYGWALPGGHVERGKESCPEAAVREVREETGCIVKVVALLGVYSRPDRDPTAHRVSVVYIARLLDESGAQAGSDALGAGWFPYHDRRPLIADHETMIQDYRRFNRTGMIAPLDR